MTVSPEKIKKLRDMIANHGKSTWAYYLDFSDAMPALLDAAEENVKLNKLLDDIAEVVGRYYAYDGPFVRAPDEDIMEAIRDGVKAARALADDAVARIAKENVRLRAALSDIADSKYDHVSPPTKKWMEQRARDALDHVEYKE